MKLRRIRRVRRRGHQKVINIKLAIILRLPRSRGIRGVRLHKARIFKLYKKLVAVRPGHT